MTDLMYPKPQKRKKVKAKKPKLRKISKLKKDAWHWFSQWIRRGAADSNGIVDCVTCGARGSYKEFHAGHYLHGHSKASFLVPENVNVQCPRCNHFLSGNLLAYHDFMMTAYGPRRIEEIKQLSKEIWKPSRQELEAIIFKYKSEVQALEGV